MSPSHPKGLWYGGLNAYENANWALADQRLSQLLTLNPPETLIPLIEERIAAARSHGEAPPQMPPAAETRDVTPPPAVVAQPAPEAAPTPEAAPESAPPAVAAAPPAAAGAAAAGASTGINLEISLDPELAARLQGPTPMFIIARNPEGGPPLAVIRSNSAELPISVQLTDANAMMEGVTISDQPQLELIARVALSGSPAQRPGDLFGTVNYVRGNSGPTRITIDRVAD